jgi:hypothetical protein
VGAERSSYTTVIGGVNMSLSESDKRPMKSGSSAGSEPEQQPAHPAVVFVELCELLEAYGPVWYTEEVHTRVFAALRILLDNLYEETSEVPRLTTVVREIYRRA